MQNFNYDSREDKSEMIIPLVIALILFTGNIFLAPLVFMQLYNWFVVPATGWIKIGYWLAFGISLLLDAVKTRVSVNDDEADNAVGLFRKALIQTLTILAVWGVAALIQLGV